jgi:hypothetical protein
MRICRGREPGKGKDGVVQLLHYNLERFEFEDPKGQSDETLLFSSSDIDRINISTSLYEHRD